MKIKQQLILGVFLLSSASCSHKMWTITSATSTKIAIDKNTEILASKEYEAYLQSFKQNIDTEMNVVIGVAAQTMKGHAPESLLSNFSADAYRQAATDYYKEKVDIAIVNLGGLRTEIPAGNITVRKVFELMPFENELVIVWLRGDKLLALLNYFASMGGEGVSGLRMKISKKKAGNIYIDNKPIDAAKLYSIATNDYLAGGNDKMLQLAMYVKRVNTGIKIRTVFLDFIKAETKKGNMIQSKLDGRISE